MKKHTHRFKAVQGLPGVTKCENTGRLRVDVTRHTAQGVQRRARRVLTHGARLSDAIRERERLQAELNARVDAEDAGMAAPSTRATSLLSYAKRWLREASSRVSSRAAKRYSADLQGFLTLHGGLACADLTRTQCAAFVRRLESAALADETIVSRWATIKRMLEDMAFDCGLDRSPAERVKGPRRRGRVEHDTTAYTPAQLLAVADVVAEVMPQWRGPVELLISTGARSAEVLGVRVSQLDLERGVWNVAGTKSARARRCAPVTARARTAIEWSLGERGRYRGDLVFPSKRTGRPPSNNALLVALKDASQLAGVAPAVTPRRVRHSVNTLLSHRLPMHVLAKTIGHKPDGKCSAHYYDPAQIGPVLAAVEAVYGGA